MSPSLPHPLARLVGCCWLPRLIVKTRRRLSGTLPRSYRLAYGSSSGVDGYFCRHFQLNLDEFIEAVREAGTDGTIGAWFLEQPGVTDERIREWNEFAPQLGSRGHPGYGILCVAKVVFYPRQLLRHVPTFFAAIIRDEQLPATVPLPEVFTGARLPRGIPRVNP